MENIGGEILIISCVGAADIVVLASAFLNKLLEFRNNVIVGACPCAVDPHAVVDLFSSVERKDNVAHLFVTKFHYFVGKYYAVGGLGEAEIFILFLFDTATVFNKLFYNLEIKRGLSAEKVDL